MKLSLAYCRICEAAHEPGKHLPLAERSPALNVAPVVTAPFIIQPPALPLEEFVAKGAAMQKAVDDIIEKFDRTRYQRDYMRERRARAKKSKAPE